MFIDTFDNYLNSTAVGGLIGGRGNHRGTLDPACKNKRVVKCLNF